MKSSDILYYPLRFIWILFSLIPLPVLYLFSDIAFLFIYYVGRYRRKVVRKNLIESFPGKGIDEIKKIERGFYRFFPDLTIEMCKFATISEKAIRKRMKFSNTEEVNKILADGKSISAYMGHYGNWEWVTSLPLHLSGDAIAGQIYRRMNNKAVSKLLLKNRGRMGAVSVEMRAFPRWIKQKLDDGVVSIMAYIADQSPKKRDIKHYVQFLNHEVPAIVGAEKIAKRYGLVAYYIDVKRIKRGYYEARFVKLHDNTAELPDFELTDIYYAHLEKSILRQPELYLWSHNRFKYAK
jgi:Lauroyl/myristoyl acyltransferase